MLQVLKKANNDNIEERKNLFEKEQNFDIFIQRNNEIEEIGENEERIIRIKTEIINLTRKINETAKVLKAINAEERLKQIQELAK